jgi:hypothetical protein
MGEINAGEGGAGEVEVDVGPERLGWVLGIVARPKVWSGPS